MSDLQLKTNMAVFTDMDRVVFRIHRNDIFIPYATVFLIAQAVRIACKQIKGLIHENERWNELATDDNIEIQNYADVRPGRQIRGKFGYKIQCDGERVILTLGDLTTGIHFVDALKISQWLRAGGKKAKLYAGDTSKHLNALGMLTDAEENYKLGIN